MSPSVLQLIESSFGVLGVNGAAAAEEADNDDDGNKVVSRER